MNKLQRQDMPTIQSPSEIYHEASKLRPHDSSLPTIYSVNNVAAVRRIIAKPSYGYSGYSTFPLPKKFPRMDRPLEHCLAQRESLRKFSGSPIPLSDLAAMLYFGAGVTRESVDKFGIKWGFRSAPSGGALYPLDIYCVVSRVSSLEIGLYAYNPNEHSLALVRPGDFTDTIKKATYDASVEAASVCILMVANFSRSKFKYGERAYRFVLLEAGHIAQNVLLVAASVNQKAYPIGGYMDDPLNELVGVDGCDRAVVYGVLIGCAVE